MTQPRLGLVKTALVSSLLATCANLPSVAAVEGHGAYVVYECKRENRFPSSDYFLLRLRQTSKKGRALTFDGQGIVFNGHDLYHASDYGDIEAIDVSTKVHGDRLMRVQYKTGTVYDIGLLNDACVQRLSNYLAAKGRSKLLTR